MPCVRSNPIAVGSAPGTAVHSLHGRQGDPASGASSASGAGLVLVLAALGLLLVVGLLGLRRRRPGGAVRLAVLVPAGLLGSLAHRGITLLALDGTAGGSLDCLTHRPVSKPRSALEDPG